MVFETDHFSIYVIVDESTDATEPEPEQPECKCGCHTNEIVKFVLHIINSIFKLFGVEFNCSCGAVH